MFWTYLDCENAKFVDAIKGKKRRWTQGKLAPNYSFRELMKLGRVTYNNIDDDNWDKSRPKTGKEAPEEQKNFLALATQIMERLDNSSQKESNGDGSGKSGKQKRIFLPWNFENPDNATTKEVLGTIMKWCSNNCHPHPM